MGFKTVKVKKTGLVTQVSEEYLERYGSEGWLIEVYKEPEMVIIPTPKPKAKAVPKPKLEE